MDSTSKIEAMEAEINQQHEMLMGQVRVLRETRANLKEQIRSMLIEVHRLEGRFMALQQIKAEETIEQHLESEKNAAIDTLQNIVEIDRTQKQKAKDG